MLIFALALLPRLGCALAVPVRPTWDGVIYVRAAEQLARGEGYTQRALREDAPARASAYYPVGFPASLALVRLAGGGLRSDLVLQSILGAFAACATYMLARRSYGRTRARIAATFIALWPSGILIAASWMSEVLFTLLLAASFLPLSWMRRRHRPWAVAISSAMLALSSYVRPVGLLVLALFIGWIVLRRVRVSWSYIPIALVAVVCVIGPWAIRNSIELGRPVLISTNGGTNLLLGTVGDGLFTRIPREIDCPDALTETARDRCRSEHAVARIAENPLAFLTRGARKTFDTFAYESTPALQLAESLHGARGRPSVFTLALATLSSLYYIGLVSMALLAVLRRRTGKSMVRTATACALLATACLHFATIGGDRYHLPLVPFVAILAASLYSTRRRTHS